MIRPDAAHNRRAKTRTTAGRTSLILASTVLSSLAALTPALARADQLPAEAPDPASSAAASERGAGGLSEIVVTATHKSENLQKVPISLQALDSAKLEQSNISSFTDYVQQLPSVSFESLGPGRSVPFFRGISVSGGRNLTVGTYLDDIPLTTAQSYFGMPEVHIYDVERVEALSGPQGTLFGAGSLAGTI